MKIKMQLAADFGLVSVGDTILLCNQSEFKFIATVERIELLTDATGTEEYDGKPVKVLFGKVISRFTRKVKASVACHRFANSGIDAPRLLNCKIGGFKQGAFAEKLDEKQTAEVFSWLA